MRVTNGMLTSTFMRDLNQNLKSLARYQQQLASGKRVSRPSDDPVAIVGSLRLRSDLADIEQYSKNVDHALSWLSITETALGQAGELVQRARDLAVQGANGTNPQSALDAIAEEVGQLLEQLVQVANTSQAGQYIFAGTETGAKPFAFDTTAAPYTVVYRGNGDVKETEVGMGITLPYNVTGPEAFFYGNGGSVFAALKQLYEHLRAGDTGAISGQDIGDLEQALDHILSVRAEVGARVNRLEMTKARLEAAETNYTGLLSKVEDVDVAQAIMELKNQENVYRAALATGARIIQPTLADFLR